MSDSKLSLHIGQKNAVTLTSGFVDVPSVFTSNAKLMLNKQTIADLNGDGGTAAVGGVTGNATRTVGRTTDKTQYQSWYVVNCGTI